jgi:PIN domain nuclease of toxin-antitoxin system
LVIIDRAAQDNRVLVSSFSVWEFAVLVRKGRLKLNLDPRTWLETAQRFTGVEFVAVDVNIAFESQQLEWSHY